MFPEHWLNHWRQKLLLLGVQHHTVTRGRTARRRRAAQSRVLIESLESRMLLAGAYAQTNIVSDGSVAAQHTDPNLVNPWGISETPGFDFWVADNGTGLSPAYDKSGNLLITVPVPPPTGKTATSTPTGVVYNGTSDFQVSTGGSSFIFSTEDGTISAWGGAVSAELKVDRSAQGAVYKGLATGSVGAAHFLYATNIHSGKIEVFDKNFALVTPAGNFTDPGVAAGFAPFGIQNIGGNLFVTYAKQDATKTGDVAGAGNGFVSEFNTSGTLIREIAAHGTLNSPWGLAQAPSNFGGLSGDLLVGNFGDGKISAFNPSTGVFLGMLNNSSGTPIAIDGLWGLEFGSGGGAGNTNDLFFTAGPGGEEHGLFGKLSAIPSVSITTASLSNWTQNQPGYSQVVATTSGTAPFAFSLQSGTLPSGLSLNASTGAITGKPTATGTKTFTVKVTDHAGTTAAHAYTVSINSPVSISTTALANWTQNQAGYNKSVTASAGTGPYTFSLLSGKLPGGLSLNASTGAITGKPTATGASTLTVKVTDKAGSTAAHAYTVTINASQSITTTVFANWTQNQGGYNQTVAHKGGTGPYTFSLASGKLPGGLSLNATTGVITGKPTATGASVFTLKVADKTGASATHAYTLTINVPVSISTTALPSWTQNQAGYSQAVGIKGGTGPYTFSLTAGALPAGLSLNASTGAITGKPTAAGNSTLTVKVADKTGSTAAHAYTVTINVPVSITTGSLANWTQNQTGYSQTVGATGGTKPFTFSLASGALPAGLSLNGGTGAITGKPTVAGTSTFTIKVADHTGAAATHSYTVTINAPLAFKTGTTGVMSVGLQYYTYYDSIYNYVNTKTGTAGYTFHLDSGTLPTGLTLNTSTGGFTGTTTAPGTFSFTVSVTDVAGSKATHGLSIEVTPFY